jgi:hypothetical protein
MPPKEDPKFKRIAVKPADVEILLGCSPRTGREIILKIKRLLGIPKEGYVTVYQFCDIKKVDLHIMAAIMNK